MPKLTITGRFHQSTVEATKLLNKATEVTSFLPPKGALPLSQEDNTKYSVKFQSNSSHVDEDSATSKRRQPCQPAKCHETIKFPRRLFLPAKQLRNAFFTGKTHDHPRLTSWLIQELSSL